MKIFPQARVLDIVQQTIDDELLICDLARNRFFCLNQTSKKIYDLCDGTNEIAAIAEKNKLPENVVKLALTDLSKQNLLMERIEINKSRRDLLRNIALTSIVLPTISTLVAPTAASAASTVCNGTAPGGFFIGRFASNLALARTVCVTPACRTCRSGDYSRQTSTCNNAECSTVDCYCAPVAF